MCMCTDFHLLVWIVGGLFDDLAVELIPEKLLLFPKLRNRVTQSVEEQYTLLTSEDVCMHKQKIYALIIIKGLPVE